MKEIILSLALVVFLMFSARPVHAATVTKGYNKHGHRTFIHLRKAQCTFNGKTFCKTHLNNF